MTDAATMAEAEAAIWSHDASRLSALPNVDPTSWAGAVQADLKAFGIDAELRWPAAPCPAYLPVAVIMMLKDEADIVGRNLEWLYRMGVRKFALCNNGSTDRSQAEIDDFSSRHADAEIVTVMDSLVRYVQALKTTALFRWAATIWPDVRWVFPVDADEFLVPQHGLAMLEALTEETVALSIPKVIHFRHRLSTPVQTDSPLQLMQVRSKVFLVPPKAACRADIALSITQGNHAILSNGRPVPYAGGLSLGFYYREFQTRSFEHFRTKVTNGGIAILAAQKYVNGSVGGDHWMNWFKTLQAGGDEALRAVYENECVRDIGPHFVDDAFTAAD